MRDWQIRTDQLVLHGTDREIPGQRVVIKQHERDYQAQHWVGQTLYKAQSAPSLIGAIRIGEKMIR